MDLKKIKQIVSLVSESGVHEVEVEQDGFKIRVTRSAPISESTAPLHIPVNPPVAAPQTTPAAAAPIETPQPASNTPTPSSGTTIKSPIVGTYYSSPSPNDPAFVKVGDRIEKGQTLCIIEAMKIMNEIESEHSGVIKEILVDNAQPVEFDQPLFVIE